MRILAADASEEYEQNLDELEPHGSQVLTLAALEVFLLDVATVFPAAAMLGTSDGRFQTWFERIGKDTGRANHSHGGEIVIAKASARDTHLHKRTGGCEREGAFTCACSAAWHESVAMVHFRSRL